MGTTEKNMKFPLTTRKCILTWSMLRQSHRLPREDVEPPAFKSHLDRVLGSLLEVAVLEHRGVALEELGVSQPLGAQKHCPGVSPAEAGGVLWSPSGEPSPQGTSTMSAEQGSGCSACCTAGRLGHQPVQSSSLRAGGRAGAGGGRGSILQHRAPPALHPLVIIQKQSLFWNTDPSPVQQGQRPCCGEAPSCHKERLHQPRTSVMKAPRAPPYLQVPWPAPKEPLHLTGWQSRGKPPTGHTTFSQRCTL